MEPLVSVVIPIFNMEAHLRQSIQSICRQTYRNLEIMCVDDASTDTSVSIIRSLHDPRIVLLQNQFNLGLAAAVNKAIRVARGVFIARMDADDIALPTRIEKQVEFLNSHPHVHVVGTAMQCIGYSHFKHVFPAGHEACKARLLFNVCVGHPTVVMRKEIFDIPENFYREDLRQYSEEYELWCRLVNQYTFANLAEVLLYYRTFSPKEKNEAEAKRKANSFKIRADFITRELGDCTSVDMARHDCIATLAKANNLSELNEWLGWLDRLTLLNQKACAFDVASLRRETALRKFEINYWNAHLGLTTWRNWARMNQDYQPTLMQELKWIARSISLFA